MSQLIVGKYGVEGPACTDTSATREEDMHSACQNTQMYVQMDKRFDVMKRLKIIVRVL